MNKRILFVDDDKNILRAYKRQFLNLYSMTTALGGREGLKAIEQEEPFAVILTDMRMPIMDGVEFLKKAKEITPDSVRIMLTGNSDIGTAVRAVNEGDVYRFLNKPCSTEILVNALNAGINLYRLVTSEKDLLNKTLTGTIKILTSVLNIINPAAFKKSNRMIKYVKHISGEMNISNKWELDIATMLSQFGCIDIPPNVLEDLYSERSLDIKAEKKFSGHSNLSYELIAQIPRLENAALMIKYQDVENLSNMQIEVEDKVTAEQIRLGAQILKISNDYDKLTNKGFPKHEAFEIMNLKKDKYAPNILKHLLTM